MRVLINKTFLSKKNFCILNKIPGGTLNTLYSNEGLYSLEQKIKIMKGIEKHIKEVQEEFEIEKKKLSFFNK